MTATRKARMNTIENYIGCSSQEDLITIIAKASTKLNYELLKEQKNKK